MFTVDASRDGYVVAQGHCYLLKFMFVCYGCLNRRTYCCTHTLLLCYMYQTCCEAAIKTVNELCYICVCDSIRTDSLCDISLKCMIVYQYVFIMFMYGELP